MSTDNVQINSQVGIDGNSYTSQVSNDSLTSQDFLKIMIQELKMQDPTKPMDSKSMLDMQMKMSSMNSNIEMQKTLESLANSINSSSFSSSSLLIGKVVGNDNGEEFKVSSVQKNENEVIIKGNKITGIEEGEYILEEEVREMPLTSITSIN